MICLQLLLILLVIQSNVNSHKVPSSITNRIKQDGYNHLLIAGSIIFTNILRVDASDDVLQYSSSASSLAPPSLSLLDRATSSSLASCTSYRPGLSTSDIFYPEWIKGTWLSNSTTLSVIAPLGQEVFGGEKVYQSALNDIGKSIIYRTKFKTIDGSAIVADRLYNIESIVIATIGENSIIEDSQGNNNDLASKIKLVIAPKASNSLFDITLEATDRIQSLVKANTFDVMERSRQIIRVINRNDAATIAATAATIAPSAGRQGNNQPPLIKDIETITCYKYIDADRISAVQRTSTFLTPYDYRYKGIYKLNSDIGNSAVDVRQYSVDYIRIKS